MAKSSRKVKHQVLGMMKSSRAERFLWDIANHRPRTEEEAKKTLHGLFQRFPDVFPGNPKQPESFAALAVTAGVFRDLLRKAWDATDSRKREWYLYELGAYDHKLREDRKLQQEVEDPVLLDAVLGEYIRPGSTLFRLRTTEPPAKATALDQAVFYFKANSKKARHCLNRDCPHPYFFQSKKGQKYCSPACSTPAKRAAKLRWWHANRGRKES